MVSVGVIGLGFGRMVHVPGFLAVRNAMLFGVAARNDEQARHVASEFSLPRYFPSWKELIECPQIQAVSIATPPPLHEEMVLSALAAGKAVLCEKPLALDAAKAEGMLKAARRAGVVHMVNFEFREIPAWQFVKKFLSAGELGSLRYVNVHWIVHSWADPNRQWSWRADRAQGGGALGALVVHSFDYLEWLLGPIKSLAAQLSTQVPQRPDESGALRPVTGEDSCHLLLELRDGTPINLVISTVAPLGKGHWIEFYGERKVLVLGSKNLLDYGKGFRVWVGNHGAKRLRRLNLPGAIEFEMEFEDGRVAPFVRLAERFVDAIQGNKLDVRPSFKDGFRAQVLLDLALQANRERCWVSVPAPQVDS